MIWFFVALHALAGLGMIAVGLGLVRPRSPRSGWLLAAAGALVWATTCCTRVLGSESLQLPPLVATPTRDVVYGVANVVVAGLVAAALITLGERKRE